jgi:hypothetical protein
MTSHETFRNFYGFNTRGILLSYFHYEKIIAVHLNFPFFCF